MGLDIEQQNAQKCKFMLPSAPPGDLQVHERRSLVPNAVT